jgi:hypothetical protein
MDLTFRNARALIEHAIRDELLLAYGRRLPPVASIDALAALSSGALGEGDLRFVSGVGRTYRLGKANTSAADGDSVVAPLDLALGAPGRWLKTPSTGAGGYLERVELYNEDEAEETMLERLLAKKSAVLISFEGARHKPVSNIAGALYWFIASYRLLVISTNMRGAEAAWFGSPRPSEAALDPGTAAMLGDLKQLLAGSDLGLEGAVERVELGDEKPVLVALAKRTVVEALDIIVWASVRRDDDDVVPLDGADVHAEILADDGTVEFSDDAEVDFNA